MNSFQVDNLLLHSPHINFAFKQTRKKNLTLQQKHAMSPALCRSTVAQYRLCRRCKNTSQSFIVKRPLQIVFYISNLLHSLLRKVMIMIMIMSHDQECNFGTYNRFFNKYGFRKNTLMTG